MRYGGIELPCSVPKLREALVEATARWSSRAEDDELPTAAMAYLPTAHAYALRPDTWLVVGARGTGKTYWTRALQREDVRAMLEYDVPELAGFRVVVACTHGEHPETWPGPNQCSALLERYDAEDIWRAVLSRAIAGQPETAHLRPFPRTSWE